MLFGRLLQMQRHPDELEAKPATLVGFFVPVIGKRRSIYEKISLIVEYPCFSIKSI